VHIHETADAGAAAEWWAEELAIPIERFRRPTIKKHRPLTRRGNVGVDYHGCLVIVAPKSRPLYWRMEGFVQAIMREASSTFTELEVGR
jgi:hypothetical protein